MTLSTSDRMIRFDGLFKKSRMAASNFSKKADQRYRTFSKKSGCASELFKKMWIAVPDFF